jgi:aspartokinase
MTWTVHKFGGTSVADASCIRRVADIIGGQRRGNLAVVVSAMKGVTDDLLGLVERAAKREPVEATLKALRARHDKANVELLGATAAKAVMAEFDRDVADIEAVLNALTLVRAASNRSRDLVAGYGEIWSARPIAAVFKQEFGKSRDGMFVNAATARDRTHRDGADHGVGPVAAEGRGRDSGGVQRRRGYHRLRRHRQGWAADDARAQRQRLLGVDFRRIARRRRGAHLDRR